LIRCMIRLPVLWLSLILVTGCAQNDSPEQQIREMIERSEAAIEARALLDARSLLSDAYQDAEKRTKPELVRLLGGYFLRNKSIHLLVQIERINLDDPTRPRVTLYAAMAANPFADVDELSGLRAALYRFDLELIHEADEWRLVSGRWQPATRDDFLGLTRQ